MRNINTSHVKLTLEGFCNIEKQITFLKKKAKALIKQMDEIALGTSTLENAEFYEMKNEKMFIAEEIKRLERLLESAELAKGTCGRSIDIGSKVKISNHVIGHIVDIVEAVEADSLKGKVSVLSPLGKALVGKAVGDEVLVETPGGAVDFKVMAVV